MISMVLPAIEDVHKLAESFVEAASLHPATTTSQLLQLLVMLLQQRRVLLLIASRDLGKALEDPLLRVADTRDARTVGKAELRHLAERRGTIGVNFRQMST
jgi:hypothetical protein